MSARRGIVYDESTVLSLSACCSMTVGRRKWAVLERRTTVVSSGEG